MIDNFPLNGRPLRIVIQDEVCIAPPPSPANSPLNPNSVLASLLRVSEDEPEHYNWCSNKHTYEENCEYIPNCIG